MFEFISQTVLYIVCFACSLYSLMAIDFEKLIKKNKTFQAQCLIVLLSLGLGYLVANFIMDLMYNSIFF